MWAYIKSIKTSYGDRYEIVTNLSRLINDFLTVRHFSSPTEDMPSAKFGIMPDRGDIGGLSS